MRIRPATGLGARVAQMRDRVESLTGDAPPMCPWRSYADPVVQAGMSLRKHWTAGAVDVDRQVAIVVDAMTAIDSTQNHVEAHDRREERQRREAEQRMRDVQKG